MKLYRWVLYEKQRVFRSQELAKSLEDIVSIVKRLNPNSLRYDIWEMSPADLYVMRNNIGEEVCRYYAERCSKIYLEEYDFYCSLKDVMPLSAAKKLFEDSVPVERLKSVLDLCYDHVTYSEPSDVFTAEVCRCIPCGDYLDCTDVEVEELTITRETALDILRDYEASIDYKEEPIEDDIDLPF